MFGNIFKVIGITACLLATNSDIMALSGFSTSINFKHKGSNRWHIFSKRDACINVDSRQFDRWVGGNADRVNFDKGKNSEGGMFVVYGVRDDNAEWSNIVYIWCVKKGKDYNYVRNYCWKLAAENGVDQILLTREANLKDTWVDFRAYLIVGRQSYWAWPKPYGGHFYQGGWSSGTHISISGHLSHHWAHITDTWNFGPVHVFGHLKENQTVDGGVVFGSSKDAVINYEDGAPEPDKE